MDPLDKIVQVGTVIDGVKTHVLVSEDQFHWMTLCTESAATRTHTGRAQFVLCSKCREKVKNADAGR